MLNKGSYVLLALAASVLQSVPGDAAAVHARFHLGAGRGRWSMQVNTLLASREDTPPASPAAARFGDVMKLLLGKHPRLSLTEKSSRKSFYFCLFAGAKQIEDATPRYLTAADYRATGAAAWVVRRGRRAAAFIIFPFGACVYWASDGRRELTAMITPGTHDTVAVSRHGTSVVVAARLRKTTPQRRPLNLTWRLAPPAMKPIISLRFFGAIEEGLRTAQGVHFLGYPTPALSLGRFPRLGECDLETFYFDLRPGCFFPIRSVREEVLRVGRPTIFGWIGVRRGPVPHGVVIHRVRGALKDSGLPWRYSSARRMLARYMLRWYPKHGKEPPLSARYTALRKQFVDWATARTPKPPPKGGK